MELHLQECCSAAGGEFIGIQDALFPTPPLLIVRNPETTNHVVVEFNPILDENSDLTYKIQKALLADMERVANRHVSVKITTLQKLANSLSELAKELNALCVKEKKK